MKEYNMNNAQSPPQVKESPWLVFLEQLSNQIQAKCTEHQLDGSISWKIKELSPDFSCIEIGYKEDDEEFPVFKMSLSNRYRCKNMVCLQNIKTKVPHYMQADPELILAWLSF